MKKSLTGLAAALMLAASLIIGNPAPVKAQYEACSILQVLLIQAENQYDYWQGAAQEAWDLGLTELADWYHNKAMAEYEMVNYYANELQNIHCY